ncbi:MAG: hypothetical protein IPK50_22135 [Fibrobacterota bacterium]|nr:MAG: hypothetical protein IPK50_22135 [Fibrobacterota bacterium]
MPRLRSIALATALGTTFSCACLWDSETIYVERIGFPSDIRMILGAFLVRSDSFHLHRKALSLQKIADSAKATPLDYDNLAVSLDKLHRDDSAIVVMKSKRVRYGPAYETMANMGTFHFHLGNFAEGLPYIDSALKINPEAHFGRERYQKWLVEYILSLPKKGSPLCPAKSKRDIGRGKGEHGYAAFVAKQEGMTRLSDSAREKAIRGVLGMMRFGNGNHPILLESYGDLALGRKDPFGRGLAVKAYLKASENSSDSSARIGYDRLASLVPKNSASLEKHYDDLRNYRIRMQWRIADMKRDRGSNFENDANKIEAFLKGPEEEADPYEGLETEIDLGEFDPDQDPPKWKSRRWKQYGNRR